MVKFKKKKPEKHHILNFKTEKSISSPKNLPPEIKEFAPHFKSEPTEDAVLNCGRLEREECSTTEVGVRPVTTHSRRLLSVSSRRRPWPTAGKDPGQLVMGTMA